MLHKQQVICLVKDKMLDLELVALVLVAEEATGAVKLSKKQMFVVLMVVEDQAIFLVILDQLR